MAKIEKIGNIQIVDNKEDKFFYFPMISMACTGAGYGYFCRTDSLSGRPVGSPYDLCTAARADAGADDPP